MRYLVVCLTVLFSSSIFAQNILNSKSPEQLRKMQAEKYDIANGVDTVSTKPTVLPYGYIEDKDLLWSKIVYEIIDLNEKLNQPYYYASNEVGSTNISLYDALFEGMMSGKITEVYDDDNFTSKIDPASIESKIQAVKESVWLQDIRAEREPTEDEVLAGTDHFKVDTRTVKLIKIKGMWYLDKRLGQMKYRLLGIAPMGRDPQVMGVMAEASMLGYTDEDEMIDLFWIFYPNARDVLSNYTVFNPKNGASSITYDDVLNARRFSSIIYKTQSQYGNGEISSYIPRDAKEQLEESLRIKNEILQIENNMWNY